MQQMEIRCVSCNICFVFSDKINGMNLYAYFILSSKINAYLKNKNGIFTYD